MLGRWYRKRETDYCIQENGSHLLKTEKVPYEANFVTYRNTSRFPLIRQINIKFINIKLIEKFFIDLHIPTKSSIKKIIDVFKAILADEEFKKNIEILEKKFQIRISIRPSLAKEILKFFEYVNTVYQEEFSIELMNDLKNIFDRSLTEHAVTQMPAWQDIPFYVNQNRKTSKNLIRFTQTNSNYFIKHLKEGEDPNQQDAFREMTLLCWLAIYYKIYAGYGKEDQIYRLIQIVVVYGGDIFYAGNSIDCLSPIEIMDRNGFPDVFKEMIMANSRVEKSLNIKSVSQSLSDSIITTEFEFENKNNIATQLLPIERFNQDLKLVKKSYQLFSQLFESPTKDMAKVKEEFDDAFSFDEKSATLVEVIFSKSKNENMLNADNMIGCTLYNIYKDSADVVLNIDYSLVDKRYRFGLMTFLDFRMGFSLALLNPTLQSAIFYCAAHINSWDMICKEFVSPKFEIDGAERVVDKMKALSDGEFKTFRNGIKWIRYDSLRVKGGYFTKPKEDLQNILFHGHIMGFIPDRISPGVFLAPENPISALVYAPMTHEFAKRMQESARFHGFDYCKLFSELAVYLSKMDKSLGSFMSMDKQPIFRPFRAASSFFKKSQQSNQDFPKPVQIRARL